MQDTLELIKNLLVQDERLVSQDGKLLKNKVQELARKNDPDLLKIILSDQKINEIFFEKIDDITIFDKDKFIQFVSAKEFLPDSYTAFNQKINLVAGNSVLFNATDIVLNFPYKDCVLEGGMSKEDQKRDEVFFNTTIAPDEITRLLDEKVFVNLKRISKDGENSLKSFNKDEQGNITDNLIIKGNNLLALHSLKRNFSGKIKLIYIDPPYNTGNDSFGYNDKFNHSTWLVFMKNRLEVAKKLLAEDGVIFVQCDDNEQAYLKVLMDEVFTRENFVNCIAVKMSEASGVKMNHAKMRFPKLKEYLLFYRKSDLFNGFQMIDKYKNEVWDKENNIYLENFTEEDRKQLEAFEVKEKNTVEDVNQAIKILSNAKKVPLSQKIKELANANCDETENWKFENSYRIIKTAGSSSLAKLVKDLPSIPKQDICAGLSKDNILFFYITDFNRETKQPRLQVIFADTNLFKNPCDFWQDIKTTGAISEEGAVKLESGKKPEKLLERIIKMTTQENDLVLDYHAGSGTTCAVAHKMNRQYIGIEQLDYEDNNPESRMKNVIEGDQSGISKSVGWNGGGEFIYMELAKWNEIWLDKINEAKTSKSLLDLWNIMKNKAFLSYKIDIKKFDEKAKEFENLSIENQKNFLAECLDMNFAFVNYSDLRDQAYKVSQTDQKLNEEFYERN